jgi:hypothetical protein
MAKQKKYSAAHMRECDLLALTDEAEREAESIAAEAEAEQRAARVPFKMVSRGIGVGYDGIYQDAYGDEFLRVPSDD